MTTLETRVYYATKLKNTTNGNPRWRLATSDGDITISSDAAVGYEIGNYERTFRENRDHGGTPVRLKLTRAWRFYALEMLNTND